MALFLWGAPATADVGDPVVIDYETAPACPLERDFVERLLRRSAHVRIADVVSENGPHLAIRITRRPGARAPIHGELVVRFRDGAEARRTVDGDVCESVVDALALMSAMTLDPSVSPSPVEPPPIPPKPPEPTREVEGTPASTPALDATRGPHIALGALGGAAFGFAPVAAPSGGGFVEIGWGSEGRIVSPMLGLGFDYASSAVAAAGVGSVQMSRTEATLDGCPFRWVLGSLRLVPCARLEAGALAASGLGVTPANHAQRPWVAAGLEGIVEYRLGRRFFFDLAGGARVPLVRDRFYFEPTASVTAFRAPIVSGFASGGVGVTIL